jgi:uncharacterized protein YraI
MRIAPGTTSLVVSVLPSGAQGVVTGFGIQSGLYVWFPVNMPGYGSGWVAEDWLTKIGMVTPTTVPSATATRAPTRTPTTGPSATATRTPTRTPTAQPGGFAPGDLVETTANLSLRTGPGTGNPRIAILPNGTGATVLSFGGSSGGFTWYEVNAPGFGTGWVAGEYLVKVGTADEPTATSTTASGGWPAGSDVETDFALNMRTGPSTSNSIVVTLPAGANCTVLSGPTINDWTWYELNCPGFGTGWAAGEFLTLLVSGASAASEDIEDTGSTAEVEEIVPTEPVLEDLPTETPVPVEVIPTETPVPVEELPTETAVPIEEPVEEQPVEEIPVDEGPQPYQIARVQRTESTSHGSVLVDEDPLTVWSSDGAAVLQLASFAVDLNEELPIGTVRWLPGAAGVSGRMLLHISSDGVTWTEIDLEATVTDGEWSEIAIGAPARFVRFAFINEDGAAVLGGIAEVEVWP